MQHVGVKVVTSELLTAKQKVEAMFNALIPIQKRSKNGSGFIEKRLETTLKKFETAVYVVADNAITNLYDNTHQGDIDRLMAGASGSGSPDDIAYYRLYEKRQDDLELPIAIGYHAGSYRYSESPTINLIPRINESEDMSMYLRTALGSEYSVGDTFYIMGVGPALGKIESGEYGPSDGILSPTLDSIMRTYKSALSAAYHKI